MAVVTLITDFGTRDAYVGMMKGAILTVDSRAVIVDVTHAVSPQDLCAAARELADAHACFPPGSIHVTVVDPGVGSRRRILAAATAGQFFLAPDNGILPAALAWAPDSKVVSVENTRFFRQPVSATFHGRDIFAPVAGHLSKGLDLSRLGPALAWSALARWAPSGPQRTPEGGLAGAVVAIDHFGNLVTDIRRQDLDPLMSGERGRDVTVCVGPARIMGIARTYADVPPQEPVALVGSSGRLEVAVHGGNAGERFQVRTGDPVHILTR